MGFEEKLIRYIASKLIQKKYFLLKHTFPSETKLKQMVDRIIDGLIEKYRQLRLVRTHSPEGLVTPAIKELVDADPLL